MKVLLSLGVPLIETLHTKGPLGKQPSATPKRNKQYLKSLLIPCYRKALYNEQNPSHPPQPLRNDSFSWDVLSKWRKYSSSKILNVEAFWWPHLSLPTCKFPLCVTHVLLPCVHSLSASQHMLKPCFVSGLTRAVNEWKAKVLP